MHPSQDEFEALQFRELGMVSGGGKQINHKLKKTDKKSPKHNWQK